MEKEEQHQRRDAPLMPLAPLRLERFLPIRDVRKLVWRHLNEHDREVVRCAHNSRRMPHLKSGGGGFAVHCAKRGHVELLNWAFGTGVIDYSSDWIIEAAVKEGQIRVLERLQAIGASMTNDVRYCSWAAEAGRLEALQWLRANGAPWNYMACFLAASKGRERNLKLPCTNVRDDDVARCNRYRETVNWLVSEKKY
jgi:hypothetical protein